MLSFNLVGLGCVKMKLLLRANDVILVVLGAPTGVKREPKAPLADDWGTVQNISQNNRKWK